jgi:hypothetical protein
MNRLLTELVQASIDISLSDIVVTDHTFTVRVRTSPVHTIFGLLFGIPAFLLLISTLFSPHITSIIGSIILCPFLFTIALFIGFSRSEKVFNTHTHTFTNTIQLFHKKWSEEYSLDNVPGVLKSENRGSTKTGSGSSILYTFTLPSIPGCSFCRSRAYSEILQFSEKLSSFLSVPYANHVNPVYQRDL